MKLKIELMNAARGYKEQASKNRTKALKATNPQAKKQYEQTSEILEAKAETINETLALIEKYVG